MLKIGVVKDSKEFERKILEVNNYESLDDIIAW